MKNNLNEIVRFEYEVVIFEIVFVMVHGRSYKKFQKNPPYISSNFLDGDASLPSSTFFLFSVFFGAMSHFDWPITQKKHLKTLQNRNLYL